MQTDLLTLVKQDGFTIAWSSNSRGGQYNGPCLWCGGTDRLRVQPNYEKYGWFICNQCGRKGSAINYLMLKRGMSIEDARSIVGWTPEDAKQSYGTIPGHALGERPNWDAPPVCWQETAKAFVQYCQDVLWSEQGKHALAYLRRRGLKDRIIQEAQLGYYPRRITGSANAWGRPVKLRQGIVLPWFLAGSIWRITIRDEHVAEGNGRYKQIAGGSNGLYLADTLAEKQPLVVVTEGEIDALSILQECGEYTAVVATGTTQGSHIARWVSLLARQEHVLIAFDAEEKGDTAARWWLDRLSNARRLSPLWKDANQMLQDGANLRQWLAQGYPIPSPLCSICGNDVEQYSIQGIAYCEQCWPGEAVIVVQTEESTLPQTNQKPPQALSQEQKADVYCTTEETFVQDVLTLAAKMEETSEPAALDLETTGLDARQDQVITIALGTPGNVTILDMRPYYDLDPATQARWREALATLFHFPLVTWIGHNLKFDWSFLSVHFGVRVRSVYDTMLVEQLLKGAGLNKAKTSVSLLETAKRYELSVTKEQRSWFIGLHQRPAEWYAPFPQEQLDYITQDIVIPYLITERQKLVLQRYDLQRVVDLENDALPATASMEVHGALIDRERWRYVLQLKQARKVKLERELVATLGAALAASQRQKATAYQQALLEADAASQGKAAKINLSSSEQLIEALAHLGIHVTSTREEALEEYEQKYPVIKQLLEWRKLSHFCSAFGENLLSFIKSDGRIHANFSQIGAVSGRMICSSPNLQQIPKKRAKDAEEEDIRHCFVSPSGSLILKADLSNIELRILAEVSHDVNMLRFFAEGKDLHAETAKLMFRLPEGTNTKEHLYNGVVVRDIAKTINFGLSYGMGAQGLAGRVDVDIETARELMQTYFTTYKGVATWLRRTAQEAIKQGYAATLAGRKRFFNLTDQDKSARGRAERSAKNHPIQGTNADILKRALALLYDALPEPVHIILVVHDEIVLECPIDLKEEAEQILKDTMVQACRDYLKVVRIPEPDVIVGNYWQKD